MQLKAAIVGSGPSGFYAAEALLKAGWTVDTLERLPVPFGLVRSGVAPDHPKLKQPTLVYDRIAKSAGFSYLGNVTVGRDVTVEELQSAYHAVIFACGAETDRRLGIPGEALPGSHAATEFVGWYNGHPDYRDRVFDFSHEVAVIVGQGNVAADVCRMLAKTPDELKHTDIARHALEALSESCVREIHIVGRRGPAQAKFTPEELRELGELSDASPVIDARDLDLSAESAVELADRMNRNATRNVELLRAFASREVRGRKRCHVRFHLSPLAIEGTECVARMVLERNRLEGPAFEQAARGTGETIAIDCGLVFRSVGYRGAPLPGVPFDERRGTFANVDGRITRAGEPVRGLYVTGWIKRGPSGIIGTNRADSLATVQRLLEDAPSLDNPGKRAGAHLRALLAARGVKVVDYAAWLAIDRAEIARGLAAGKPREKFTCCAEMLEHASHTPVTPTETALS